MKIKYTLIEYQGNLFLVSGIGAHGEYDYFYYATPLEGSLLRTAMIGWHNTVKISIDEAKEITCKNRLRVIMILYGA